MIAQLQHDHDRLRDIADRLDAFLVGASPPTSREFGELRWMLVQELSTHLANERNALNGWSTSAGKRADELDVGLDDAFAQHIVTWSGATLSTAWDKYRGATRALLDRLRKRMAFEESAMFPELAGKRLA